ncbi:transcription factor pap1 protein [Mucor ambiguus]|uniref:Transcription factor pap1 protein n=1 Tax=Mucor ambiguus TaxID=91626 RepID=A0A0C9LWL7_9FUNG|nr:transcription factor pap1 protein [Mucor ambiguus]
MSLTSNPNMTPSEILQLNLNDSALDLLNAAIASHQVKVDNNNNSSSSNDDSSKKSDASSKNNAIKGDKEASLSPQTSSVHDEETSSTAPKRAGRKPLDKTQISDAPLDPKQKRKAQNRAAQRAFRDRKEKHVAELQARIAELEALNATKDEDLVKENKQLKEMLQKLQEENYALKGAQFTFEFPVNDSTQANAFALANNNNNNSTATAITDMSHRSSSDKSTMYQTTTSGSSMSSNNSYSGEDVASSAEQSPLSNSHTHEDDSTSADTPINSVFSAEPMQFGLIHHQQPSLQAQQPSMNNSLDFFAVSDNSGFNTQQTNSFPTGDLFHGKDDLFANYRVPTTNNANDDFLFANEDLSGLFGGTDDLFGLGNSAQLNMAAQFGLPETPASRRLNLTADKKEMLLSKLKQGQQEGKFIYQVHQDIKQQCPDFNLDLLCDELKKKASCSMSSYPLTDHDVDAFVKCLDRI